MTPVKIGLPSLVVYADHLHISSLLLNNTDSAFPSVVVEYVEFTDVFGQKFRSESFYIPPAGASHFVNCDIPTEKEPYLKKAHIEISLLTSTGVKYSVLFACETHYNPKCIFVSSDTRQMTSEEQAFSSKIFQAWFKQQGTKLPIGGSAGAKPPAVDTTLEQLRKAVFTEMYYLKNNGGRQYKVSSGKFICKMNSLYAYQFEMESEVYLADDSPVKVSCVAGSAEGTVLLCDGFEILLLLESDLGSSISSGSISVEPWKLLESLNKKIENMDQLSKQKEKAKAIYGKHSQEVLTLEKEIKTIRKKIRLEERKYVDHARILATTVSKIHADSLFDYKKYDVVMFDEVSMAYVAQILCAATFAKERFICVGDFRQLSPIAQSKAIHTICFSKTILMLLMQLRCVKCSETLA